MCVCVCVCVCVCRQLEGGRADTLYMATIQAKSHILCVSTLRFILDRVTLTGSPKNQRRGLDFWRFFNRSFAYFLYRWSTTGSVAQGPHTDRRTFHCKFTHHFNSGAQPQSIFLFLTSSLEKHLQDGAVPSGPRLPKATMHRSGCSHPRKVWLFSP